MILYTKKLFLAYVSEYINILKRTGVRKMYVVCNEHLDIAIEEFIEIYEQPPDIYLLDKISFTDWTSPNTCDHCDNAPKYLIV